MAEADDKKGGKTSKMAVASKGSLKTLSSGGSSESSAMKGPSSMDKMAKIPKFQPTYRLDSKKPFKPDEVYKIVETIVLKEVETHPVYDPSTAMKLIQTIAADVRASVRHLGYDRYKICVFVYMVEKKLQGFQAAFRALWDYERDGWTTYLYQCRTYFLSCTCYGLYHD